MSEIIDRIESNRTEKARKISLNLGIVMLILSGLQILFGSGVFWSLNHILIMSMGIMSLIAYWKLGGSTGQFIEWKSDSIAYKLKGNSVPATIEKRNIREIAVKFDVIEIKELNGNISKLDISDFADYSTRTKIKNNFENITVGIPQAEKL